VNKLLEGVDWRATTLRLTKFAHMRTKGVSWELAEDLAQEAITQLLDPRYMDWDPEREPELLEHLQNVVRGLASNRRRTAATSREIAMSPERLARRTGDDVPEAGSAERAMSGGEVEAAPARRRTSAGAQGGAEERAVRRDIAAATARELAARFADDPDVLRIVALAKQGKASLSEQAEAMGITMQQVHNARQRLHRGLAAIQRELSGEQENDHASR
jgi:predicted transcriptional regulator